MSGFSISGSFDRTDAFLKNMLGIPLTIRQIVQAEAERGVAALVAATPKDSGLAASSWGYQIVQNGSKVTITWTNSDVENGGFPVAIMLQYGYGTGSGGYVQGRDYINPAMKPIFDTIANNVMKAVKST